MFNFVACKVCYYVLVVTFPMPHDRGCEIKIIVIGQNIDSISKVSKGKDRLESDKWYEHPSQITVSKHY